MRKVYWNNLSEEDKSTLLLRELPIEDEALTKQVAEIIQSVKTQGDLAIKAYTLAFDNVVIDNVVVMPAEFAKAEREISNEMLAAIEFAITRLSNNAKAQIPENTVVQTQDGVVCERQWRAIPRVGLYVPAGSASLVSTLLMLAVPANLVGCEQVVLCTPVRKDGSIAPEMLVAAKQCGIQQVFKVGGAQAIAAMAYGTQTIPKVDKIFGPGNCYVTQAKMLCGQTAQGASMDLPAGPSEIMVIADKNANVEFVAADLLSQAEHDIASQVFLLCDNENFINEVVKAIEVQIAQLPRRAIALASLQKSAAIVVDDLKQAIAISNLYAPEHLSLQINNPRSFVKDIQNAGTVFLGPWTAETLGDYVTGANHVLPTNGNARSYSGLSVLDFMKTVGVQEVSREGLKKLAPFATRFAQCEGLFAHENAITIRLNEVNNE